MRRKYTITANCANANRIQKCKSCCLIGDNYVICYNSEHEERMERERIEKERLEEERRRLEEEK